MENLLHELIGGKGHGLGGDTADVVERKASVQSLLDPVLLVHIRQGLAERSVQVQDKKCGHVMSGGSFHILYFWK